MKYLKISHNCFILILLLILSGCVSETSTVQTDNYSEQQEIIIRNISSEAVKPIEISKNTESPVEEIDIPVYSLAWTVPVRQKESLKLILPEIPIIDKKSIDTEASDHQYVSSFPNYNSLEAGYVYDVINLIDKAPVNQIPIEQKSVDQTPEEQQSEILSAHVDTNIAVHKEITKTVVSERDISAPVLDKLDISLEGMGWIYLPDKNNESIEYIGRKFTNESTVYLFIPTAEGHFNLTFQFQDLKSDNYIVEKINLKILKNQEDKLTDNITNDLDFISEPENIIIEDKISLDVSINQMLQNGDCEGLAALVVEILDTDNFEVKNILPEIAECLYNSTYHVEAIRVLEKLVQDEKTMASRDYLIFCLGKLYEKDSKLRNEQISANYYKRLIDNFPTSIYWDESQDRYRYLKRRYIDIR